MTENRTRLHELDSLRALAAIGVIAWHYTAHFQASPLAYLLQPFYRHGLLLVDFFFTLSGFVLARAYWTDRRSRSFIANLRDRVARIYPLHVVMLCIVAAMQWYLVQHLSNQPFVYSFNDKYDFALNAVLLNRTGLERGFSFNAPSWSISTEFVVNVFFFSLIALPRVVGRAGLLAVFFVSLAVVSQNGLISNATALGGIDNDIFRTIVGFLAGVAASVFNAKMLSRSKINKYFGDFSAIACIAAFLYYCVNGEFVGYWDLVIALTCFPLLILGVVHGYVVKSILRVRPLVYLGTISYSIYLVHYPLQLAIHVVSVAMGIKMPYGNAFFLIAYMLLTVALASFTYWAIESPSKRLIRGQTTFQAGSRVVSD